MIIQKICQGVNDEGKYSANNNISHKKVRVSCSHIYQVRRTQCTQRNILVS